MRRAAVVLRKELLEGVRDRRSLLTALLFPLLGPLAVGSVVSQLARTVSGAGEMEIAVAGDEYAPGVVAWLRGQGVRVVEAPADPETAVRSGELAVVVRFAPDFAESFGAARPALVELVVDGSRTEDIGTNRRVEALLDRYSAEVGSLRLLARGVAPDVATALQVDPIDVATPEKQAASFLEMVNMMILLASFFCNMYVAIDTTAGERERRSMEPLLLTPVPRVALVSGKVLAAASFGAAGVALTIVATGVSLAMSPLEQIGARVDVSPLMGLVVFGTTAPLVLFAASFQVLLASFARSFKEAQTLVSVSALLGMLPGMMLTLSPFGREGWMMAVPVLSQQLLTGALARGEVVPVMHQLTAAGTTIGAAAVCVLGTVFLFRREGITSR